jgi:hypothetical protein
MGDQGLRDAIGHDMLDAMHEGLNREPVVESAPQQQVRHTRLALRMGCDLVEIGASLETDLI